MDAFLNFAKAQVSTTYDAAAVTIVLTSGGAARLPAVPFNAVWWNATDYADPSDDPNREIVRVTGKASETLTITRAQEGTSASTKNTAAKTYLLIAPLTLLTVNQINLSLPVSNAGDPNSVLDGNPGRPCYDTTNVRTWFKTTSAGTLTGWQ